MPDLSVGILMYRRKKGDLQVLLVHPGGPFWNKKELGAWSIPKGLVEKGEDAFKAAQREFTEETGFSVSGDFISLKPIKVHNSKIVQAWAVEGDCDTESLRSNTFTMEWPPRSGEYREFPEADRAAWFGMADAKKRINKGQRPLLEQLECALSDIIRDK